MFHFEKSCEISFQVNGIQEKQTDVGLDSELLAAVNLYMVKTEPAATTKPAKPTTGYKRKSHVPGRGMKSCGVTGGGGGGEGATKKILHRDTERQRRIVMTSLLNNLYSLLPTEFVKGKRSVTDHIGETINYIKNMQNNIKELEQKRDRIRTLKASSTATSAPYKEDFLFNSIPCNVTVLTRDGSLEIQISGGGREDGFRLSEPLRVLLEEGLDVVCSVSSKVNGSFIHNIQCQMSGYVDVQRLQQRLYDVVCPNSSGSSGYEAATDHYSPLDWLEKETQFYSLGEFCIM